MIPEANAWTFVVYFVQIAAPIIVTFFIKSWLKRGATAQAEVSQKFDQLQESFDQEAEQFKAALSGVHKKLNRMEIKLASSGVDDLKANIEVLKDAKTKHEMRIEAAFREIDELKERSN